MTSNDHRAQYRSHENPKPKRPKKMDEITEKSIAEVKAAMVQSWADLHRSLDPENRPMLSASFEFGFMAGCAYIEGKTLSAEHGPGCYAGGPPHYSCALDRIVELESAR